MVLDSGYTFMQGREEVRRTGYSEGRREEAPAGHAGGRDGHNAPQIYGNMPGETVSGGDVRGGGLMEGGGHDTTRSDYDRGDETRSMPGTGSGAGEFGLGLGRTPSDPTGMILDIFPTFLIARSPSFL